MSCFIIDDKSISKIINFFVSCAYSNEGFKPSVTFELKNIGYDLVYNEEEENPNALKLFKEMKTLNDSAYNLRYNIKTNVLEEIKFNFDETKTEGNIFQILKSLECFLYQCMEGDFYIENTLWNTLNKIVSILRDSIISELEEYKKAKWE